MSQNLRQSVAGVWCSVNVQVIKQNKTENSKKLWSNRATSTVIYYVLETTGCENQALNIAAIKETKTYCDGHCRTRWHLRGMRQGGPKSYATFLIAPILKTPKSICLIPLTKNSKFRLLLVFLPPVTSLRR